MINKLKIIGRTAELFSNDIQKYQNELSMWAGGGITIASDAEAEYQECLDKISAMIDLLNTWQKSEK